MKCFKAGNTEWGYSGEQTTFLFKYRKTEIVREPIISIWKSCYRVWSNLNCSGNLGRQTYPPSFRGENYSILAQIGVILSEIKSELFNIPHEKTPML